MSGDESTPDSNIQLSKRQQTKPEKIGTARPNTTANKKSSKTPRSNKDLLREALIQYNRLSKKAKSQIIIGLSIALTAIAIAAGIIFGICLPLALDQDENQYLSENNLTKAVAVGDLSLIDYIYKGIAEHISQGWAGDTVDYRVKYEAHIGASCDFSAIKFHIDTDADLITAYLPEITIEAPILNDSSFDYLPENTSAELSEVIALCKDDAENEINEEQILFEANESLKNIVEALTMPLLAQSEFELEFANLPTEE